MLGIDFLKQGKRSGLEFINFQNDDFRSALTEAITPHLVNGVLKGTVKDSILPVIEQYTGFKNISVEMMQQPNFAIDVGYFSPANILNIPGIDKYFDVTDTNLSNWYTKNKGKAFKGSIDYKTGKVYGAYAEVPLKLYLGTMVGVLFEKQKLDRYNVEQPEVTAGCIAHELGHAFFACAMVDITSNDNFIIRGALNALGAQPTSEKRVMVIRSVAGLLEATVDNKDDIETIAESSPEETLIYFNALINRRNSARALSLGVATMSSEVLADVYAIRMGFDRGLIAGIAVMSSTRTSSILWGCGMTALFIGSMFFQLILVAGVTGIICWIAVTAPLMLLIYGVSSYSSAYNSPFRRYEDGIRQLIAKMKEVPNMSAKDKSKIAERAAILLRDCEKYRPIISGTFVDRMIGRIIQGADFKAQEFEHFTQAIANNEMAILDVKLNELTA